ncbi:MAG: TIR domain-containing protein [Candidatus Hodarchaeota archaeon]
MSYSEPMELIHARKLIEEAKFEDANQILTEFKEKNDLLSEDIISYYLLKCSLARFNYNHQEFLEYANKAYQESQKLESSLQLLDVYLNMSIALNFQGNPDEVKEFIFKSENLIEKLNREPSTELTKRKALIAQSKSYMYSEKGKIQKALKYAEHCLALQKELNLKASLALSLYEIGLVTTSNGNLNSALEYLESSKLIAQELEYKRLIQYCDKDIGVIYGMKGELDLALSYNEQVLASTDKEKDKKLILMIFNNNGLIYQIQGKLDLALEYMEKSLSIAKELGNPLIVAALDSLFHLSIDRNELEKARQYLQQIKQITETYNQYNTAYRIDKALYLKTSSRALNRGKAEEILKHVLEDKNINYEMSVNALLNLCDLLLFELRATNELEILSELQTYISRVLDIALNSRSYSLLAETYLLQARLALIMSDMDKARKLFSKSQKLAQKCDLNLLAMRISSEHDQLLTQLEIWENLKKSKAPIEKRVELAHLNDQILNMLKKRTIEPAKLEVEIPVLFAILTKEGKVVLSTPFTSEMAIDETRFGEFLSSCNEFCDQIFSESFDRVKFGRYTILITTVDPFCVYYMFQGHSYSAQQKLTHLCEALSKDPPIIKILENYLHENKTVVINEHPTLEKLIIECFLSDPQKFQMPFKAYEGDESFVFVSYSHTDKLQVYPIIDYLNKKSINIWYDEGIPISENWKRAIVENLDKCTAFLVFITPHIIDSEYVRKEISYALKRHKPFFTIYLRETDLPHELIFDMDEIQAMKKYLMPETEFYAKLREMLVPVLQG